MILDEFLDKLGKIEGTFYDLAYTAINYSKKHIDNPLIQEDINESGCVMEQRFKKFMKSVYQYCLSLYAASVTGEESDKPFNASLKEMESKIDTHMKGMQELREFLFKDLKDRGDND